MGHFEAQTSDSNERIFVCPRTHSNIRIFESFVDYSNVKKVRDKILTKFLNISSLIFHESQKLKLHYRPNRPWPKPGWTQRRAWGSSTPSPGSSSPDCGTPTATFTGNTPTYIVCFIRDGWKFCLCKCVILAHILARPVPYLLGWHG